MSQINKDVEILEKEIVPVIRKAVKVEIKNVEDMKKASEMLSVVNKYADTVQDKRESITGPLNTALKAARAMFKPLEEQLDEAIENIRGAMTVYQTEELRKQREEETKIAARVGEGKGKIKIETAVRKMNEMDKVVGQVVVDSGMVKFKTSKKFRIIDKTLVPLDYMVVDEVAVRKAMLAGLSVAGVEYYEEQVPMNYR